MRQYTYLGDRFTGPQFRGEVCEAVTRADGKCIRGRNGTMLVAFDERRVVVVAQRLRRIVEHGR